jgi:hypothetical protein
MIRTFFPGKATTSDATTPILTLFAVVAGMLAIAALAYVLTLRGGLPFPQDAGNAILGRDFLNTWFFGKAAFLADPGRFYDHDIYMRWINETVPQEKYNHLWSYPPTFLMLAAPVGLLPYPLALAAWSCAGLLALYAVVRGQALRTFTILLSPAAFFCLISGQISLFMAAFALGALRLLDRRPVVAGILIAFCTIKPQMGLLFPVLLICSRRWNTLISATLSTLALVLATGLIWGFGIWHEYVALDLPAQIADTKDTFEALAPWSPTVTTAAILAGLGPYTASLVQIAFAGLAALLVALGCARGPMDLRRTTHFLACSVFAAPYLLTHDLVAVTAAATLLAASEPLGRWGKAAVKALFLLPLLQYAAALVHLPGVALIPVWLALWALRRREPLPVLPAAAMAVAP